MYVCASVSECQWVKTIALSSHLPLPLCVCVCGVLLRSVASVAVWWWRRAPRSIVSSSKPSLRSANAWACSPPLLPRILFLMRTHPCSLRNTVYIFSSTSQHLVDLDCCSCAERQSFVNTSKPLSQHDRQPTIANAHNKHAARGRIASADII